MKNLILILLCSIVFLGLVQVSVAIQYQGAIETSPTQINSLKPGDIVSEVSGIIVLPPSGDSTFPPDDSLEFDTQLGNAKWAISIIINGVENPPRTFAGSHAIISGMDLAYPLSKYEVKVKFSMTDGIVPTSFTSGNIILVRARELDTQSNQVGSAVLQSGTVMNPSALQTQIDSVKAKLAILKADIDAKNALGVDTSVAQQKYNSASSACDTATIDIISSPTMVPALLDTATNNINDSNVALDRAWTDQSIRQAMAMLSSVDGLINEFIVNDGLKTSDPRLVPIINKRDLAAQAISNANDLYTTGAYPSARGKADEGLNYANEAYTLSLALKAELVQGTPNQPVTVTTASTTLSENAQITPSSPAVTNTPVSSTDSDLVAQLKRQNELLEQQNKQLAEQSNFLTQIISLFQRFFGIFGFNQSSQSQETTPSPTTTSSPVTTVTVTAVTSTPSSNSGYGAGGVQQTKNIFAIARQNGIDAIVVTWQGGSDNPLVSYYQIFLKDSSIPKGPYQPIVGSSIILSGATTGPDHVVVTAYFSDSTSQVVLDTYV